MSFSALANFTYYFGVIGNGELDLQYFFPTICLTQNDTTLVEDGNANYVGFESPEAAEAGELRSPSGVPARAPRWQLRSPLSGLRS
jgi:hypothetical protein